MLWADGWMGKVVVGFLVILRVYVESLFYIYYEKVPKNIYVLFFSPTRIMDRE